MRRRQLAHRGQLLHAGARGIGVEDADADAALVQPVCQAVEDAGHLGLAGHVLDPAAIAHGIAERPPASFPSWSRSSRRCARTPSWRRRRSSATRPLSGLAPIPGCDRQHARLEVERRRHPVERLHAVGRDRLAVRVQVDEAGSHHQSGRVDRAARRCRARCRPRRSGHPVPPHRRWRPSRWPDPPPGRHVITKPAISPLPHPKCQFAPKPASAPEGAQEPAAARAVAAPIEADFRTGNNLR